jgi:hypothetical protein
VPEIHQPVRHLGPPAGDVEVGEQGRRVEQGSTQQPIGLADVGQLSRRRRVHVPVDDLAHHLRHDRPCPDEDRLSRLDRRVVEVPWSAEPQQVALDGQGESGAGCPRAPRLEEELQHRRTAGEAVDEVCQIAVGDRVEHVVGDLGAAQPGGQPPREAGRQREFEGHGC